LSVDVLTVLQKKSCVLQPKSGEISQFHGFCCRFLDLDYSKELSEESRYLSSILLTWLLASSYREVRDKATKALVTLYENQPLKQLLRILKLFEDINDPYIQERLYCVAYGVVLRSTIGGGEAALLM
jgi:hypothetical protein